MKRVLVVLTGALALTLAACGGSGAPSTIPVAPGGVPNGSGGVRIALTLGGGPHAGTCNLAHTNPCRFNNPNDGDWALTATFPNATSGPSIVDLLLSSNTSFVDAWFGNDQFHAPNVSFGVNNRGETATLTTSGEEMSGPQGQGPSFPVQITVDCDRVAVY